MKKLNIEQENKIKKLCNGELTIKEISNILNISYKPIHTLVYYKKLNVKKEKINIKLTLDQKNEILNLYNKKVVIIEIAKKLNLTYNIVYNYIRNNRDKFTFRHDEEVYINKYLGKKFGNITVIERYTQRQDKHFNRYWKCQCDCGKICILSSCSLLKTKSCGCLNISNKWKGFKEISKSFFFRIKSGAKAREIEFNITIEQIWDLFLKQNRKCALSGIELKFPKKSRDNTGTASLDRIDSLKGYTIDNVQWVHKDINMIKMDLNEQKFLNWIKTIYINNQNQNNDYQI